MVIVGRAVEDIVDVCVGPVIDDSIKGAVRVAYDGLEVVATSGGITVDIEYAMRNCAMDGRVECCGCCDGSDGSDGSDACK